MSFNIDKNKLYYLASPYSAKTAAKRRQNYLKITYFGAVLTHYTGAAFIMPITTSHVLKEYVPDLGTSWEFWQHIDIKYLSKCDGIVVVQMPGWKESVGVTAEIEYAKANKIEVIYLTQEEIYALHACRTFKVS